MQPKLSIASASATRKQLVQRTKEDPKISSMALKRSLPFSEIAFSELILLTLTTNSRNSKIKSQRMSKSVQLVNIYHALNEASDL